MKLNLIIPVHNEECFIEKVLADLDSKLRIKHTITVIDDCSSDHSLDIIKKFANRHPNTVVFSNDIHRGFAYCLKKGFKSTPDNYLVVPVMADCCDEIGLIEKMYYQIDQGYDIVCGSRYISGGQRIGGPFFKKWGGMIGSFLLYKIKKIPCTDLSNSFKMYQKEIFDSINIESESFEISMEVILKAYFKGYRITELPTIWKERADDKSKFNLWKDSLIYLKWFFWALLKVKNRHRNIAQRKEEQEKC